jgi:hypothetical protein
MGLDVNAHGCEEVRLYNKHILIKVLLLMSIMPEKYAQSVYTLVIISI